MKRAIALTALIFQFFSGSGVQEAASLTIDQEAAVEAYMNARTTANCPEDAAVGAQAEADVVSDGCTVETYR